MGSFSQWKIGRGRGGGGGGGGARGGQDKRDMLIYVVVNVPNHLTISMEGAYFECLSYFPRQHGGVLSDASPPIQQM